jgi:alkanesulfonate monooxygenase SsuD/methylene tetrahydromethanopterin reductase-like flavin-dependent oxidoreductase (luciferase family)
MGDDHSLCELCDLGQTGTSTETDFSHPVGFSRDHLREFWRPHPEPALDTTVKFELGAYSFGVAGENLEGEVVSTAQAVRNMLDQIRLAEEVGLDFYGVGEHHTAAMPVSSPAAIINAAAASTSKIILSTAVSVLSTDDPIRLYQQMATAAIVSGNRVEIIAGRGSSTDSFPLFGYDLDDYDNLYADKLGLLLAIDRDQNVSWDSPFRPPLENAVIVPRPDKRIPIWLGTGGNPGSTVRAGQAGLPISYGILSGTPQRWGQMGALYRQAAEQTGVDPSDLRISVAGHGFIAADGRQAKEQYFRHESAAYAASGRFAAPSWADSAPNYSPGGMVFAGDPREIADRIIDLHHHLGHDRHFLQMDIGGMPHAEVLKSIELLGTEVAPRVRAELADT